MSTIPFYASIYYQREASYSEKTFSLLSRYFHLKGHQITVVKSNEIKIKQIPLRWFQIALKIASFVFLFPITLPLLAIHYCLRSRYHFILEKNTSNSIEITSKKPSKLVSDSSKIIKKGKNRHKKISKNSKKKNSDLLEKSSDPTPFKDPLISNNGVDKTISEKTRERELTISDDKRGSTIDSLLDEERTDEETQPMDVFKNPKILLSCDVNDCVIFEDNTTETPQLKIGKKKPNSEDEYLQLDQVVVPILVKIMIEKAKKGSTDVEKKHFENAFNQILKLPIDLNELIVFLWVTDAIFILNTSVLSPLLNQIHEKNLVVDWNKKCPLSNKMIYELILIDLLLEGEKENAEKLLSLISQAGIDLKQTERLLLNVSNRKLVEENELRSLSRDDQITAYKLANIYSNLETLKILKGLGQLREEKQLNREGPAIFGFHMNALEMHEKLQSFLQELRKDDTLLTKSEFVKLLARKAISKNEKLKHENNVEVAKKYSKENYKRLGLDFSHFLAKKYMEEKTLKLGLKYVNFSHALIWFADNLPLKFKVDANLEILDLTSIIDPSALPVFQVFSEKVEDSVDRNLTKEELFELLNIFEATGFSDIREDNIIKIKEGIYFKKIKFKRFYVEETVVKNNMIQLIKNNIENFSKNEQDAIMADFENKFSNYQKKVLELQLKKRIEEAALKNTGCIHGPTLIFDAADIFMKRPSKGKRTNS